MFSFFRKKPSTPSPAPEPLASFTSSPSSPDLDDLSFDPAPMREDPPPPAPQIEEEPEPQLTFEEWDRLLAAEREKAERDKRDAPKSDGPTVDAAPASPVRPQGPKGRVAGSAARQAEAEGAAPPLADEAAVVPASEIVPQPPAPLLASAASPAPVSPEARPVREETPLETALRRCDEDPYDADCAHALARLAYAEKKPEVCVAPLVRSAGLLMSSDANTAVELLSRLLIMKVDTVHSDVMLAELCLARERMREAEQALRAALRHDAENLTARQGMIRVSLAAGRPQEAIEYCHHVLAVDANGPTVWEQLGDAHALSGNATEASDAWLTAARLYGHAQSYDAAIRVYTQIVMVDPNHPTAAEERATLGYVDPSAE